MKAYIHIAAQQVVSKSPPPLDHITLNLSGVSPDAYDTNLSPIRTAQLRHIPSSITFDHYPNLRGNLGTLEVIPVPTPARIEALFNPEEGMKIPMGFVSTFHQHYLRLDLSPYVHVEPILEPAIMATKRGFTTIVEFLQYQPDSEEHQLVHLQTPYSYLKFAVSPREYYAAIDTRIWRSLYERSGQEIDVSGLIGSNDKILHTMQMFEKPDPEANYEVADAFCSNFKEKRTEYIRRLNTDETDSEETDSDSDLEIPPKRLATDESSEDELAMSCYPGKFNSLNDKPDIPIPSEEFKYMPYTGAEIDPDVGTLAPPSEAEKTPLERFREEFKAGLSSYIENYERQQLQDLEDAFSKDKVKLLHKPNIVHPTLYAEIPLPDAMGVPEKIPYDPAKVVEIPLTPPNQDQ